MITGNFDLLSIILGGLFIIGCIIFVYSWGKWGTLIYFDDEDKNV